MRGAALTYQLLLGMAAILASVVWAIAGAIGYMIGGGAWGLWTAGGLLAAGAALAIGPFLVHRSNVSAGVGLGVAGAILGMVVGCAFGAHGVVVVGTLLLFAFGACLAGQGAILWTRASQQEEPS
jgi:hypothetical protein